MPRVKPPIISSKTAMAALPLQPGVDPQPVQSQQGLTAVVERVRPAVERLLADGIPRSRRDIVQALSSLHPRQEISQTIVRLAITGQLTEVQNRFTLPAGEPEPGEARSGRRRRPDS